VKIRKGKIMRKIVATFGDAHGNSTAGLCKPVVNLDDGGTYHANQFQKELWMFYEQDIKFLKEFANNGMLKSPAPIIGIVGGDMGEGDAKDRSNQLISRNPATITNIAIKNIEPFADICQKLYFLRGTAAHVGKSASLDEQIADNFDNTARASESVASRWELKLNVDGYHIYASHHPPSMTNPVNAAMKLRDLFLSYGEEPPDLGLFFHVHHIKDSGESVKPRVISSPCWQVRTEHTHRIPIMQAPQIGMLIFEITDGALTRFIPRRHPFKMAREEIA